MPYYTTGDYYGRGDYYQGDPGIFGFLKKTFGKVLKIGVGALTGYATGGIKGAIGGAAGGAVAATTQGIREETLGAGGDESALTPALRQQHAAALERAGAAPPGTALTVAPGMGLMGPMGYGMRRQHPNRSTYVTRGGGTSRWPQQLTVHPKGTELVTSRRMNVGNARALRRALRRARGFAKLAHKVLRATHQFKGKGFGRAKKRR